MKMFLKRLVPLLLAIGILASIGWYLLVYDRTFTRDVLLSQARYHDTNGHSEFASWLYDLAYEYTGQEDAVAIELAEQYKRDGNYTKAEYTLTHAIADKPTVDLYIALCKTYVQQDKLQDAAYMLDSISDTAIKAQLDAMRPAAPTADPAPGFYSQYITLSLTSSGGTLYCTTSGDYPSIETDLYTGALILPAGETTIHTVSIADNGLVSPLTVLGYTIGGVIEEAEFTDPAMEAAVRAALGADEDDVLMTDQLWDIKEFTVPTEAVSVEDLRYLPYLETLTMQERALDSLTILSAMTRLRVLDLTGCRFPTNELSLLARLPELKMLNLTDCGLSTLAGLKEATSLTHLYLGRNALRNLEPLTGMVNLMELDLKHNAVTDLTLLAALTGLETLDLSYNVVTDISPITELPRLSRLDVSHNSLSALDGIEKLQTLTHLAADSNSLTSVYPISQCAGLVELSVASNQLIDISSLNTLTVLEVLDFSYNAVTDVPAWPEGSALTKIDGSYNKLKSIDNLRNLQQLTYVLMDYNELTNVNALSNCYRLVMVNVYGNNISDVSALTEHNIIVNYDPT